MRNVKEADERKKEILDIAEELFVKKGYDNTSTSDILERAGIARGTLYYHFKSKEEILDALIGRNVQTILAAVKAAVKSQNSAMMKLTAFIGALKTDSPIGREITEYAHRPQNALMHQKIHSSTLAALMPIAEEVIRCGIAEGYFNTDYPDESAEMLMIYSSTAFDDLNELTDEERVKKAAGFVYNMERLFGMPNGSLSDMVKYI